MAQFAIPTPDENLKPGWNVQGTGVGESTSGVPGLGYGSDTNVIFGQGSLAETSVNQGSAGGDSMNGSTGPYVADVLQNPGYANNGSRYAQTITLAAAVTSETLSSLPMLVENLNSGDVTYKIGTYTTADSLAVGDIIPAGAVVTAPEGAVFITMTL